MVSKAKQSYPIIIGRCSCDETVKYPFYWSEELIEEAKKIGYNVIDLKNENFIEQNFSKHMQEQNPRFVFLNGHGTEYFAMGFNKQPVLIVNKNDYLLKGKIAHIISCFTAKFLAQSSIDKGCEGYIGYNDYFYIWFIEDDPSKDIISIMFKEAVNETSKTLINGGSIKEAYEQSQEIYEKRINECKGRYFNPNTSEEMRDNLQDIIAALIKNKKNQIYLSID